MMRTTLEFDDALFRDVKRLAAANGQTLTRTIEDLVRAAMATVSAPRGPVELPAFRSGTGPAPGVDLDRTNALLTDEDELSRS